MKSSSRRQQRKLIWDNYKTRGVLPIYNKEQ